MQLITTPAKREDHGVLRTLLAPFSPHLAARDVYEVVVNRPGETLVEGSGGWRTIATPELSFAHLMRLAKVVASTSRQAIDEQHPILSATLPDDERIQIVIPPAVPHDTVSLTIRKPSQVTLSLDELDKGGLFGIASRAPGERGQADDGLRALYAKGDFAGFLDASVRARKNIIISGATGSGKTTLSKALIGKIPLDERIITIEDTPELVIPQPNHVRLFYSKGEQGTAKIGPRELLESCLRMRPDRILLQELRDGTAFYYLRNVNSGHPGSITTVHADSARLAFEQLTLLVKESEGGRDLGRDDIRSLLTMLVDIVVQCKRVAGQFRVTEIHFEDRRGRRVGDGGGRTTFR